MFRLNGVFKCSAAFVFCVEQRVEVRLGGKKGRAFFRARLADSGFKKTRGIMFSPPRFSPLLFDFGRSARGANSIHSFFCPVFDAVYLDAGKRVTHIETVRPWRFFVPAAASRFLIEMPAGAAKRAGLRPGIKLFW